MDATTQALVERVVQQVARVYARRCEWVTQAELEQEGWLAVLDALPRYDATRGDLGGFLYGAAQRAVHRLAWRLGSAVTVYTRNAGALAGQVRAVQLHTVAEDTAAYEPVTVDVEQALDDARARQRIAEVVGQLLAEGREAEAVLAVIRGEATSAQAAAIAKASDSALTNARDSLAHSIDALAAVLHEIDQPEAGVPLSETDRANMAKWLLIARNKLDNLAAILRQKSE